VSHSQRDFEAATGERVTFVPDNHSTSARGVVRRGLHYRRHLPQGRMVRAVVREVFDVAVELRTGSATYGRWAGVVLSADNRRQLWIPPGLAHGFLVTSDAAEFLYKTTDYYHPEHERALRWNDPAIGIEWPLEGPPTLSARDASAKSVGEIPG
jgi:dTDP-4-dehydrorhamnose 3,5-epimerase